MSRLPEGSVIEYQDHLTDEEIETSMETTFTGGKPGFAGRYEPKAAGQPGQPVKRKAQSEPKVTRR